MQPGKQFEQLPMFMTGREILRSCEPNDWDPMINNSRGAMWRDKVEESRAEGLVGSIKRHGVQEAVAIRPPDESQDLKRRLMNGHHRAISAAVVGKDVLVPVKWVSGYGDPDTYDRAEKSVLGY